jgi:chitodextrinase
MRANRPLRSLAAAIVLAALAVVLPSTPAQALQGSVPATTAASWQTNGTVWGIAYASGVVYVGGDFTSVRPPGSAAGQNEVPRNHLAAFNASTGALITSFNHNVSGSVQVLTASPDGSTVYAGGDFTTVDGVARSRVAAFTTATGALTSFAPAANGRVRGIAATATSVYLAGSFSRIGTTTRSRIAAVTSSGTLRTDFAPTVDNVVYRIALSRNADTLYLAGAFSSTNGDSTYHDGAALDTTNGQLRPFPAISVVPVASPGCISELKDVTTDADSVYFAAEGTGGGCFDGVFSASTTDGSLNWVSRCLGATQNVTRLGGLIYTGSHSHDCSADMGTDPDAFPEVGWSRGLSRHLLARDAATGHLAAWYPNTNGGASGGLGPRVSATDGTQLFIGGEFTTVNGQAQQGFARFSPSTGDLAVPARPATPVAVARAGGKVSVYVQAPLDLDDTDLVVRLFRDGGSTPIATAPAHSLFWRQPVLAFEDNALAVGTSHRYTADAVEANGSGTSPRSASSTSVTVVSAVPSYATAVNQDSPSFFWRLGESARPVAADSSDGLRGGVYFGTPTFNQPGAIGGDPSTSIRTDGSTAFVSSAAQVPGPTTYSVEAWINTTTTSGGRIVGFGDRQGGYDFNGNPAVSSSYDRHVYMTNDGRLVFGSYNGGFHSITTSASFNDGQWHHIVGTQGASGMVLYVDGVSRGTNSQVMPQPYDGYWRVGGDNLGGWPNQPSSNFFAGQIDDVSVYPTALSKARVVAHYVAAGQAAPPTSRPSDGYGRAVYDDGPFAYWRLDDASGPAVDTSDNGFGADYIDGVTRSGPAAIGVGTGAVLDGASGNVAAVNQTDGPSTFSTELWFKTATTSGGKLIGFGNSRTGMSGAYDKQVYMTNDGRLIFGVYNGSFDTVTTAPGLNDDQWHYVVATQGAGGMRLYVDDVLVGQNGVTTNQGYQGYWRVGGDNLNFWPDQPTSAYFAGDVDEIALYPGALTASQVDAHYLASGRNGPDTVAPQVSVTSPQDGDSVPAGTVTLTADATDNRGVESVDFLVDGSVVGSDTSAPYSFSWTAAAGQHTITAKATDAAGNVGTSATVSVDVTAPDTTPPSAPSGLTGTATATSVDLSWSASTDDNGVTGYRVVRDGTVVQTVTGLTYTDTGLTPGTTYHYVVRAVDAAGNVSDDSNELVVQTTAQSPLLYNDTWSNPDGAAWASAWTTGAANGTVDTQAGAGRLAFTDASGAYARAQLTGVATQADSEVLLSFQWGQTTQLAYANVYLRGSGGWQNAYRPRTGYGLEMSSTSGTVSVRKNVGGTATTIHSVAGAQTVTTAKQWLRLGVSGSTIRFKIWTDGQTEPTAWTDTVTDTSVTDPGQLFVSTVRGGANTGAKFFAIDDLTLNAG